MLHSSSHVSLHSSQETWKNCITCNLHLNDKFLSCSVATSCWVENLIHRCEFDVAFVAFVAFVATSWKFDSPLCTWWPACSCTPGQPSRRKRSSPEKVSTWTVRRYIVGKGACLLFLQRKFQHELITEWWVCWEGFNLRWFLASCLITLTVHSLKLVVPERGARISFSFILEDGENNLKNMNLQRCRANQISVFWQWHSVVILFSFLVFSFSRPNFSFLAVTVIDLDRMGMRLKCAVLPSQLPENKSDSNIFKCLKSKIICSFQNILDNSWPLTGNWRLSSREPPGSTSSHTSSGGKNLLSHISFKSFISFLYLDIS